MERKTSTNRPAIIYQSLYLANLLLLPGLSFLALVWLFIQNKHQLGWQRIHLYRSMQLSIAAGLLIIILPLVVVYTAQEFQASIMVMLVYFVTIHAAFVLIGMLNIARAMAKKLPLF